MQEKRYQVFISSTFIDLQAERRAVQDVVISTGDFPVQMESFPAADEDQLEFIKTLIDQCDYYVLIVAGRYGTAAEGGLSYTHKEFQYAVSKGVPVLVMLHGDRGRLPADRTESTDDGRRRLAEFIVEAETGRLRKTWTTLDGLKLAVREALDHAKATKPRPGWIRGDSVTSLETLEELNFVRKENDRIRQALSSLHVEIPMPSIPAADDPINIDLLPQTEGHGYTTRVGSRATIRTTWISVFPIFFGNLNWSTSDWNSEVFYYINEELSYVAIGSALAGELAGDDTSGKFKISKGTFDRLSNYYIEAGLMITDGAHPFTEAAQRIARRHSISRVSAPIFTLLSGEVKVTTLLDDDVPF